MLFFAFGGEIIGCRGCCSVTTVFERRVWTRISMWILILDDSDGVDGYRYANTHCFYSGDKAFGSAIVRWKRKEVGDNELEGDIRIEGLESGNFFVFMCLARMGEYSTVCDGDKGLESFLESSLANRAQPSCLLGWLE